MRSRYRINVPKVDFFGSCDPYVSVECGTFYKKTKVIKGTLTPCWNEDFVVENEKSRDVFFCLKDHNMAGKNETLGVIRLSIDKLEPGNAIEGEFDVIRKNEKLRNGQGEGTKLKVSVKSVDPMEGERSSAPAESLDEEQVSLFPLLIRV